MSVSHGYNTIGGIEYQYKKYTFVTFWAERKKLCHLKISWPKKVIPTKSYSLTMLHLPHTMYLNHAQPRF